MCQCCSSLLTDTIELQTSGLRWLELIKWYKPHSISFFGAWLESSSASLVYTSSACSHWTAQSFSTAVSNLHHHFSVTIKTRKRNRKSRPEQQMQMLDQVFNIKQRLIFKSPLTNRDLTTVAMNSCTHQSDPDLEPNSMSTKSGKKIEVTENVSEVLACQVNNAVKDPPSTVTDFRTGNNYYMSKHHLEYPKESILLQKQPTCQTLLMKVHKPPHFSLKSGRNTYA